MWSDHPPERTLFRLFYLEDNPELSEDLRDLLPDELPGTVIDWAGTIDDGLAVIAEGRDYDLGLLDVRVPRRRNLYPEAHPDVAAALRQRGVALLIYTAYVGSADVEEYLQRKLTDPPLGVISKRANVDFVDEIVAAIRDWFVQRASSRISTKLNQTFNRGMEGNLSFRGTGALLSLQQDIVDYWSYLNADVRQLVATRFHIRETSGQVTGLTLIPAGA